MPLRHPSEKGAPAAGDGGAVGVAIGLGVQVGVCVGVTVMVAVAVCVAVAVAPVAVAVGVAVFVAVAVAEGVGVTVGVEVGEIASYTTTPPREVLFALIEPIFDAVTAPLLDWTPDIKTNSGAVPLKELAPVMIVGDPKFVPLDADP
jgi:hypothetical protein